MRIVIGVLLLGHAVAHLPGFLVNLRLRSFRELPYRTTVLNGAFELGETSDRWSMPTRRTSERYSWHRHVHE